MLGSVKGAWTWIGSGKHPAAGDYFKVGQFTPILGAIADWFEKGFQNFITTENSALGGPHSHNSWRFWMRSPKTDHLAIGVVRDSSDSLGRPYPFLIAGTGPLKKCGKHWNLLPFACEKIWNQIEYLGTGQFADVKQIADRVSRIYPPDQDWLKRISRQKDLFDSHLSKNPDQTSLEAEKIEKQVEALQHRPEFMVSMDMGRGVDPLKVAGLWHRSLKNKLAAFPNALFMGGVPERTCLAVFQRPLSPPDFNHMWSAHKE